MTLFVSGQAQQHAHGHLDFSTMRAYFTVILDSFHEAFASRVLYILLAVLTIVLAGLMPLGFKEERAVTFQRRDIRDWPSFYKELQSAAQSDDPSPGKRIVELAGEPLSKIVNDNSSGLELSSSRINEIVDSLNALLTNNSLYDVNSWRDVRLRPATVELLKPGPENLSQEDLTHLNRLLLRDAFPGNFASIGDKEFYLTYAWWTLPEPMPGGKTLFPQIVKAMLAAFMDLFVGTLAIFVAILVTSSIIPRTFEPGAIDLLLSKPISRTLLLLSKYLGGCAFILLSAGYFITGVWLIMGLRLGVWSEKLLLCIPIFMFQFAIYYAVSMFSGVIWRNPVVSIAVTILFFLSCFTVGTAKVAVEQSFIRPNQFVRIVPTRQGTVCVTRLGKFVQWNEQQRAWDDVLQSSDKRPGGPMGPPMMPTRVIGPVYDEKSESLLYVKSAPPGPPRFMGFGSQLMTAKWSGNWEAEAGPVPPSGTSWMFLDEKGQLVLVAATGVFTYLPKPSGNRSNELKIFGFGIPIRPVEDPFIRSGPPDDVPFSIPYAAGFDSKSNQLVIDNEQSLLLLARTGDQQEFTLQTSVEHAPAGPTLVGLNENHVVVASKSGRVEFRNPKSLQVEQNFQPVVDCPPASIETSRDGRFITVLYHNGSLWLYDEQTKRGRILAGNITGATFENDNLIVADSMRQVRAQDLLKDKTTAVYSPKLDTLRWYYWWLIRPLHTVFPKPGELSNIIKSMLTDSSLSSRFEDETDDLREARIAPDTTAAVVHSLVFVLIVLGITCWYVERLDL